MVSMTRISAVDRHFLSVHLSSHPTTTLHQLKRKINTMESTGKFELLCLENPLLDIQGQGLDGMLPFQKLQLLILA